VTAFSKLGFAVSAQIPPLCRPVLSPAQAGNIVAQLAASCVVKMQLWRGFADDFHIGGWVFIERLADEWAEQIGLTFGIATTTQKQPAPNPVTSLWSGCIRLHSQRLREAIFR
jgi:hypothetical protein